MSAFCNVLKWLDDIEYSITKLDSRNMYRDGNSNIGWFYAHMMMTAAGNNIKHHSTTTKNYKNCLCVLCIDLKI